MLFALIEKYDSEVLVHPRVSHTIWIAPNVKNNSINSNLNFDGPFRCEHAFWIVVGRSELDPLFSDFSQFQKTDHLKCQMSFFEYEKLPQFLKHFWNALNWLGNKSRDVFKKVRMYWSNILKICDNFNTLIYSRNSI